MHLESASPPIYMFTSYEFDVAWFTPRHVLFIFQWPLRPLVIIESLYWIMVVGFWGFLTSILRLLFSGHRICKLSIGVF